MERRSDPVSPEILGFIAEGTRLEGRFTLTGDFRVDGEIVGAITSSSALVVGPPGAVHADELRAGVLSVSGLVRGTLRVTERLEIHDGGRVEGTVRMSRRALVIHPGGTFAGTIEMPEEPVDAKAPDSVPAAGVEVATVGSLT